eukprot:31264-Pelagococcus_subviridis.AAC.2
MAFTTRTRSYGDQCIERTLRVDEEKDAVHHVQDALHLAAKVRVTWGVDDVHLRALVRHRGVLGEDGDPALALEVVGVHDASLDLFVVSEHLGLREHRVHERGLPVVDVRDDGDVADVVARLEVGVRRGDRGGFGDGLRARERCSASRGGRAPRGLLGRLGGDVEARGGGRRVRGESLLHVACGLSVRARRRGVRGGGQSERVRTLARARG